MGCYRLTDEFDTAHDAAIATLQRAYELGVRCFDTAPMYGEGQCDQMLGEAFGHLSNDDVFIAAKLSGPPGDIGDFSYDKCMRCFDLTLKHLRRDSVPLLQIHGIPAWRDLDKEWKTWRSYFAKGMAYDALVKIREQGGCRYIGATSHMPLALADAIERHDIDCVETTAHNLATATGTRTLMPVAERHGVSTIIASPLGNSCLVSLDKFAGTKGSVPGYDVDAAVQTLRDVMDQTGYELYQLALLYLLADPRVTCIISGPSNVTELEANFTVMNLPPLDEAIVERLRTVPDPTFYLKKTIDNETRLVPIDTAAAAAPPD